MTKMDDSGSDSVLASRRGKAPVVEPLTKTLAESITGVDHGLDSLAGQTLTPGQAMPGGHARLYVATGRQSMGDRVRGHVGMVAVNPDALAQNVVANILDVQDATPRRMPVWYPAMCASVIGTTARHLHLADQSRKSATALIQLVSRALTKGRVPGTETSTSSEAVRYLDSDAAKVTKAFTRASATRREAAGFPVVDLQGVQKQLRRSQSADIDSKRNKGEYGRDDSAPGASDMDPAGLLLAVSLSGYLVAQSAVTPEFMKDDMDLFSFVRQMLPAGISPSSLRPSAMPGDLAQLCWSPGLMSSHYYVVSRLLGSPQVRDREALTRYVLSDGADNRFRAKGSSDGVTPDETDLNTIDDIPNAVERSLSIIGRSADGGRGGIGYTAWVCHPTSQMLAQTAMALFSPYFVQNNLGAAFAADDKAKDDLIVAAKARSKYYAKALNINEIAMLQWPMAEAMLAGRRFKLAAKLMNMQEGIDEAEARIRRPHVGWALDLIRDFETVCAPYMIYPVWAAVAPGLSAATDLGPVPLVADIWGGVGYQSPTSMIDAAQTAYTSVSRLAVSASEGVPAVIDYGSFGNAGADSPFGCHFLSAMQVCVVRSAMWAASGLLPSSVPGMQRPASGKANPIVVGQRILSDGMRVDAPILGAYYGYARTSLLREMKGQMTMSSPQDPQDLIISTGVEPGASAPTPREFAATNRHVLANLTHPVSSGGHESGVTSDILGLPTRLETGATGTDACLNEDVPADDIDSAGNGTQIYSLLAMPLTDSERIYQTFKPITEWNGESDVSPFLPSRRSYEALGISVPRYMNEQDLENGFSPIDLGIGLAVPSYIHDSLVLRTKQDYMNHAPILWPLALIRRLRDMLTISTSRDPIALSKDESRSLGVLRLALAPSGVGAYDSDISMGWRMHTYGEAPNWAGERTAILGMYGAPSRRIIREYAGTNQDGSTEDATYSTAWDQVLWSPYRMNPKVGGVLIVPPLLSDIGDLSPVEYLRTNDRKNAFPRRITRVCTVIPHVAVSGRRFVEDDQLGFSRSSTEILADDGVDAFSGFSDFSGGSALDSEFGIPSGQIPVYRISALPGLTRMSVENITTRVCGVLTTAPTLMGQADLRASTSDWVSGHDCAAALGPFGRGV